MHVARTITTSITGIALAFSMLASTLPANAAAGYHAAYFSESDFLAKSAGQTGQFAVGYTNTGNQAWVKGAANQQANLATAAPLDNTTDFTAGWSNGWLSANRYTSQDAALVAPGQIGFFIYNFTVPAAAAAGEHRFYGREVIDGVTWMEDYGYYQSVTVAAASAAPTTTSLTPNFGSSAGGDSVVIAGTGFVCTPTTPTVNFGTTAGTVTSCGATSITVTSPAGAIGTVQVTVANAGGAASSGLTYTYTDTTKPNFSSFTATGNVVALTFSEPVCQKFGTTFAVTDYSITRNGLDNSATGTSLPVCTSLTDRSNGVTTFSVTTANSFLTGDAVSVTAPFTTGTFLDAAGNSANPQTRTATGAPDTTAPFISTATAPTTTSLKLTYSERVRCLTNDAVTAAQFNIVSSTGTPVAQNATTANCSTSLTGTTTITLGFATAVTASGTVTYTAGPTTNQVRDLSNNFATSPQSVSFAAFAPDTIRPLSQDIRMTVNAGFAGILDTGDVFTVAFNEAMAAPTTGAKIRLTDADGTVSDVVCGTAPPATGINATCTLNVAATTINAVSYPAGQVITVTLTADPTEVTAGTTAGLAIPSTVIDSAGFTDPVGNTWDIVNSPDKILN